MSILNEPRTLCRQVRSRAATVAPLLVAFVLMGCGGATRRASVPHGKTTTTSASIAAPIDRLVVAERGNISMVSRGGCVATVHTSATGGDELRVRCPKAERLNAWFDGADKVMAGFAYEPVKDDDEEEIALPAAKVLTGGKTLKVTQKADVQKLAREVSALSAELALAEEPAPGPDSASGWQMLHVSGPARVLFAGTPAKGAFDARVSTNGQYLCEFVTNVGDGAMKASKSGWLEPATASKAIDEVLAPFAAVGPTEKSKSTYAAGMKGGAETRSNASSTAAVLERFTQMQEALGDACLPEIEVEPAQIGL
jgi:hypothetical protein